MTVQTKHTNRLIHEASPYLLQHANNPVQWYPWGDDAFAKARQEDKPVFLSIGYSTCHWCHVMAHESFENEHIAAILNQYFVSIKVDREELPDVDAVYMEFIQRTTGSGGWPMTVFLTPEAKPFYGGTYFPPVETYGRPGLETVLNSVQEAWQHRRDELLQSAERLTAALEDKAQKADTLVVDRTVFAKAYQMLEEIYDARYGGFGGDPKFPQPSMLSLLLTHADRTESKAALEMVENTLVKMSQGGIYDHLGGGFHRYAVDEKWLIPHFEKMLYDQALICRSLIQAFQIAKTPQHRETAEQIFEYVLRDMTAPQGGFYSAEDADSDGQEGTFYVWTPEQIDRILSLKEQRLVKAYYGVTEKGNFEHGTSILNIRMPLSQAAEICSIDTEQARASLDSAKQKMFAERSKRIRPHRDEKIIAAWNGLMISSLAHGGVVFDNARYIQAAANSADFVLDKLYGNGRLKRYYGLGRANENGVLEDYAYLVGGLIDLYQADFDPRWLQSAVQLADQMIELFADQRGGGFYMRGSDAKKLIIRNRPHYDGATPSGNSVAAAVLIRLSELTGNKQYLEQAHDTLASFQANVKEHPLSVTEMLTAVDLWLGPRSEIVIAGPLKSDQTQRVLNEIQSRFLPRTVVLIRDPDRDADLLDSLSQAAEGREMIDQKTTVYLCRDFVCKRPITDFDELKKEMNHWRLNSP